MDAKTQRFVMKNLIFILLCNEAAEELEFTTKIKLAYYLYKEQVNSLDNVKTLRYSVFIKRCFENINSCIYQMEGNNDFINKLPENSGNIANVFAMRIISEYKINVKT